ncbi:transposable element Tcb1 transposase [Trichonephila clavipes]|nr:transposable element Tcb1 transposase [Trichonephila clavipes]
MESARYPLPPQENTIERHRYGGYKDGSFGRKYSGSRTDLHVQSVPMTGHIYRDVILEQHVRLFWELWVHKFCLWMTTPVLTVQTLYTNAFNRRRSHDRLDDFLRWTAVGRLETGQSEVAVDRWFQVA